MIEEKCATCGCEIGNDGICLELWLRVPEDAEVQQALARASQIAADAFGVRPEVRVHEGYVTPPECFCSFSCLSIYAVKRWQQADLIKNATKGLSPQDLD